MRPPFLPEDDDYSGLFAFFTFLTAVAIGLLFLAHAAFAQPTTHIKQDRCSTIEQFVETLNRLPASIRNSIRVRILRGDDAARWRDAFNAIPPVSDIQMDRVAFVISDDPGPVVIAGEFEGCVVGVSRIPQALHQRLLRDSNNVRGSVS